MANGTTTGPATATGGSILNIHRNLLRAAKLDFRTQAERADFYNTNLGSSIIRLLEQAGKHAYGSMTPDITNMLREVVVGNAEFLKAFGVTGSAAQTVTGIQQ